MSAGAAGARAILAAGRREPRRGRLHPVPQASRSRTGCSARRRGARAGSSRPASSAGRTSTTTATASSPACPTILLHSLSHLLITAVSLECGYPASSIRERDLRLAGTATASCSTPAHPTPRARSAGWSRPAGRSHGTSSAALDLGRLCSNDPVCAQHDPQNQHECRFLHGAACHGCLLIAETSCEQHNDFLDRALVVPTVEDLGAEFFKTTLL